MNNILSLIFSLSVSGSLLAVLLLILKMLINRRISKRFYYYIWLIVLFRLCLPITGPMNLFSITSKQFITEFTVSPLATESINPIIESQPINKDASRDSASQPYAIMFEIPWIQILFLIWFSGTAVSILWYALGYLHFSRKIRSNSSPPSDDTLAGFSEIYNAQRVKLIHSDLVCTPMLIGLIKPTIVLPTSGYNKENLHNIFQHELSHYRRHDLLYKWFAMVVLSIHWFNPLMLFIRKELNSACELACDESIICNMSDLERQHYGETILFFALNKQSNKSILVTTVSAGKLALKKRLLTIMNYKKTSAVYIAISVLFALLLAGCSITLGPTTSYNSNSEANVAEYTLADAKLDGCVVYKNMDILEGQDIWDDFVVKSDAGEVCSVKLAFYFTLPDESKYSTEYYNELKDSYPIVYIRQIYYDGNSYIYSYNENAKEHELEYKYLMKYSGSPRSETALFSEYVYFVLVNDNSLTWEQIEDSLTSSQFRAYIDHQIVYSDLIYS